MESLHRLMARVVLGISVLLALFSLFLPIYAFIPNLIERAVHLGLVFPLVFLGKGKARGGRRPFFSTSSSPPSASFSASTSSSISRGSWTSMAS